MTKTKNAILYYYKLVEQPCELSAYAEFSDSLTKVSFDDIHEGDRLPVETKRPLRQIPYKSISGKR